jgi:hypothetical protein
LCKKLKPDGEAVPDVEELEEADPERELQVEEAV